MNRQTVFKIIGSLFLLLSVPLGVILVQQAIKYFSRASGTPANLVIDLSGNLGGTDVWRNLAQGGEEKGRMILPVISQVKTLSPEYIRIDHIFDFYTPAQLDEVIGDITATGAKPFISLSYMPVSLAQNGDINNEPNNWSDWENLVKNTVEHISGKNGLAISNVYYEVWNEPDLFGGYKIGGTKNYLDLYAHSVAGANRASNALPFKIGGPATTGYYANWIKGLTDFTSKNNIRLDFISWHLYSKNLDDYTQDVNSAHVFLKEAGYTNVETVMSEIGPNSEIDVVYDEYFGAIHFLATSAALQDRATRAFTFEIIDGPGPTKLWGRWGLYTNPKFGAPEAKPRVGAINFLNSLIGGIHLPIGGQGSWVRAIAKKYTDGVTKLLIVNYDPAGKHEEFVPVRFTNLSSGNFTLKRINFSGGTTSENVATTSAEWATNQYMKPNSAMIFELTPR